MQCELCGYRTDTYPQKDHEFHALEVWTCVDNEFGAVFGFYDQRDKRMFYICGACLVDRLLDRR